MDDLLSLLQPGGVVTAHLVDGRTCHGQILARSDGWLQLMGEDGLLLINLAQVVTIAVGGAAPASAPIDADHPKPVSREAPARAGSRAPGRAWLVADLKALADGFIDAQPDAALAARFHRTRGQLKELRQGFECARGNLVADQISPVARIWVERWRRVLGGRE